MSSAILLFPAVQAGWQAFVLPLGHGMMEGKEARLMTNNNEDQQTAAQPDEAEIIRNWFFLVQNILKERFPEYEVDGQAGQHQLQGPMLAYHLSKDGKVYSCGFFLQELVRNFQNRNDPVMWLESFFVDLIRNPESRPLPSPPQSEDDAKELFDKIIVPHCAQTVRDEFSDQTVYVDLELHPEHGPVLEAGFPVIKDGNNTCAIPLHYLLSLYLLNRDPADPIVQAMSQLYEQIEQNA
jgi:hypothetical protein